MPESIAAEATLPYRVVTDGGNSPRSPITDLRLAHQVARAMSGTMPGVRVHIEQGDQHLAVYRDGEIIALDEP